MCKILYISAVVLNLACFFVKNGADLKPRF